MRLSLSASKKVLGILLVTLLCGCETGSKGSIRVNPDGGGNGNNPITDGKPTPGKISTPLAHLGLHLFQLSLVQSELVGFLGKSKISCRDDISPAPSESDWVVKRVWGCKTPRDGRFARSGKDSWTIRLKNNADPNNFALSDIESLKYENEGATSFKRVKGNSRFHEFQMTQAEWNFVFRGNQILVGASNDFEMINANAKPVTRFEIHSRFSATMTLGNNTDLSDAVWTTNNDQKTRITNLKNQNEEDADIYTSTVSWSWAQSLEFMKCSQPLGDGTAQYSFSRGDQPANTGDFKFSSNEKSIAEDSAAQILESADCQEKETNLLGLMFQTLEYLD